MKYEKPAWRKPRGLFCVRNSPTISGGYWLRLGIRKLSIQANLWLKDESDADWLPKCESAM
ncbi:hypothetical protein SOASR014_21790 [Pectobacterium carotovorum subsp. carotovorum]|nr:hypothetical protein SOASR014_21790 [Pectobacterium carotovorum subsp. carotovorum]GLX42397.1 hypothetical protein Pcaca01_00650 [Pectobacterium carotovorum subsp. carotovorum]